MKTWPLFTLASVALAAGCSFPTCVATKTVDMKLPTAGLRAIDCESHNGSITIVGDPACTEVALHADIEIRAFTDEEAATTLGLMSIRHEFLDGKLVVRGACSEPFGAKIPTYSFVLTVPPAVAVRLLSHNGPLTVRGIDGDLQVETHNGGITVGGRSPKLVATTHNGTVNVDCAGDGPIDGTIESHNGEIEVVVAPGRGAAVDASTHNGSVRWPDDAADTGFADKRLCCRLGDGKGQLEVSTHNGSITVRRPR